MKITLDRINSRLQKKLVKLKAKTIKNEIERGEKYNFKKEHSEIDKKHYFLCFKPLSFGVICYMAIDN